MAILEYHIPYKFVPRHYQVPFMNAMLKDKKRYGVYVAHRRSGKDKTCLNIMIPKMLERVGLYAYLLPELKQARRIIWSGRDREGMKFLDHFPPHLIKSVNHSEMKIELINGSVFQLLGSDTYNSLVGFNPIGLVFSEYSLTNPMAWDYMRPILAENGGWAIFQGTPRGENHFYDMFLMAQKNSQWYAELLNVNDTKVVDPKLIQDDRESGMPEEMIQQEYYCSWASALVGSYYGAILTRMIEEKSIQSLEIDPSIPVHTAWDLGVADATAIWFFQFRDGKRRLVHYYENTQVGLPHYAAYLDQFREKHKIQYGIHFAPHDSRVREWASGKNRLDIAKQDFNIKFRVVPMVKLSDGIECVIKMLPEMLLDPIQCRVGYNALRSYQREWDNEKKIFSDHPRHDWSSHGASAMMYLCVGWKDYMGEEVNHSPNRQQRYSH